MIKTLYWREQDRSDVMLGSGTRINPETNRAQLEADSSGAYPTTADLYVRSRLTTPQAVRAWSGFEAMALNKSNEQNAVVTSVSFRLSDGAADYYWDGASWSVAGAGQWSSEADVATNISAFPATPRKLQVVANLKTSDAAFTPELVKVKVLYDAVIEFQEDLIYRSLVPLVRSSVRPIARAVFSTSAVGASFNVSELALETGYDIVGVDSVFNYTADPSLDTDLLQSYDSGTGVVTLSSSVAAGVELYVRFVYRPVVAVTTSQDYIDAEMLPQLTIADIRFAGAEAPNGADSVTDKSAGTAVIVPSPLQGALDFTLLGVTDKAVDAQRLIEAVNTFARATPLLWSTGLDEPYRLQVVEEYEARGEPTQSEIHVGRATFRVHNFRQWLAADYTDQIVSNLQLNLSSV